MRTKTRSIDLLLYPACYLNETTGELEPDFDFYDTGGSVDPVFGTVCPIAGKALIVSAAATPPSKSGAEDGSIILTVTNAGANTYYKWEEKKTGTLYTTKDLHNIGSGEYCYTVTDGCRTKMDCITIYVCGENPMIITETIVKPCTYKNLSANPKIDLTNSGTIKLTVSGGVKPYKYKWNNGQTTNFIANITVGNYSVTVTDEGGCTATKSISVSSHEFTQKRDECTDIFFCDGSQVDKISHSIKSRINEADCRFSDFFCEDQPNKTIGSEFLGLIPITTNFFGCVVEEHCTNGTIFSTLTGSLTTTTMTIPCETKVSCSFLGRSDLNYDISVTVPITSATISSGGWCTDFTYCNGQQISSFTYTCSGFPSDKVLSIIDIVPNPFYDQFVVRLNSSNAQKVQCTITNVFGKTYWTGNHELVAGKNEINLEGFGEVPQGLYIVEFRTEKGETATAKANKE